MKQKRSVQFIFVILFIITLSTTFILAQDVEPTDIDRAYSCFETELGSNCAGTKSTKQAAFSLLAGSYDSGIQSACKSSLNEKKNNVCWGETKTSTCNIKSTALSILALNHVGDDISDSVDWLIDKEISETGLTWYLEIDSNNRSECTINGQSITIEDNKKLTGTPPAGLKKAYSNYWFEITDSSKNYTVSCDKDFITALIYQKPGSNVFHVSSDTKSASEFDSVSEKVNSLCLSTSNKCDYEGTLWGAIALAKSGKSIDSYIPYLTSMSDEAENRKFLPSAFLYIITAEDEYYSEIISLQKTDSSWDESRNKFYDTALALLSLQNVNSDEVERSKRYLLSVQKENGCWQSDTAFILHAAWPKNPLLSTGTTGGITDCEEFGNYCVSIGECDLANQLSENFYCPSSAEVCCNVQVQDLLCSEKFGIICDSLSQDCNGDYVTSFDSNSCCIGDCVDLELTNDCEAVGFVCRVSCSDSQEEKIGYSAECNLGEICCGDKSVKGGGNLFLIILLIILIILIIIAIIFRNQLKVWIFKRRSGLKSGKQTPYSRPPGPPGQLFQIPGQFLPPRRPVRRRATPRPSGKDREFDDTMKKLRDMSK